MSSTKVDMTPIPNEKIGATPICELAKFFTDNKDVFAKRATGGLTLPDSFRLLDGFPENSSFSDMWANVRHVTLPGKKTWTAKIVFRWSTNLQITTLEITWEDNSPGTTLTVKEKLLALNPPPTRHALSAYAAVYNTIIIGYCNSKIGKIVDKGECGELAIQALKATGLAAPEMPIMPVLGWGRTWGYCIYTQNLGSKKFSRAAFESAMIKPGDIIQLSNFCFSWKASMDTTGTSGSFDADLQHTAIITEVVGDTEYEEGGHVKVIEQNVVGVKKVTLGFIIFGALTRGKIEVFRSVGADWGGQLEASSSAGKVSYEEKKGTLKDGD